MVYPAINRLKRAQLLREVNIGATPQGAFAQLEE